VIPRGSQPSLSSILVGWDTRTCCEGVREKLDRQNRLSCRMQKQNSPCFLILLEFQMPANPCAAFMKPLIQRIIFVRSLLRFGEYRKMWHAGLLVVGGISALGLLGDFVNTAKFGQIDLRNRVVGARAMLGGLDPYLYRWQPGAPTTLLDPYDFEARPTMSAVTVTPTVLALHALAANLHYRYHKFIWLAVQLLLFGGLVSAAIIRAKEPETKAAILVAGVMFSCTTFWRLHVERGQAYVLYYFVAVLYISLLAWRHRHAEAVSGFVLGVLVCLRPHLALLGLPLITFHRLRTILGAFAGIAVGVFIPLTISPSVWPDYVQSMWKYASVPAVPVNIESAPKPAFHLPEEVEGATNLASYAVFGDGNTSLKRTLGNWGLRPPFYFYFGLLVTGVGFWFFKIHRLRQAGVPLDVCSVKMLGVVLFAEIVLPISRFEYSNVILLAVVVSMFSTGAHPRSLGTWEWVLILGAWCFSAPFPPWMAAGHRLNLAALIAPYAILIWIWFTPWRPFSTRASVRAEMG
jgi:hypothetical protein